jgi:hypothetical protein
MKKILFTAALIATSAYVAQAKIGGDDRYKRVAYPAVFWSPSCISGFQEYREVVEHNEIAAKVKE